MSEQATCAGREGFAEELLAGAFRRGVVEHGIEVNFGSAEHSQWERATYVRQAEDARFHIVRRAGVPVRVHDHQLRPEFRAWLEVNPFPYGRYTTTPEVSCG